ncbi:protein distal antenna-like [Tribolium madens]|uniref:protein distal antenna-like n=1 Tax=Tribolium madens TaxID=41895 RepID=UPI001CF7623F|nr:protein distal antenna-like [Tribolium madens]
MSTKNVKRSLRTISAHGKLEAIRRVHDGESKASVARDIGVPESTLRGWCKNESKISYLSRQSSPDTDESIEPKDKRPKIEDPIVQPFNLSLKSSNIYTPTNSESLYTPMDYTKNDIDCTPKTPQNLSIKTETTPKTASQITERERNRAELARLSVELGLNRPEMFTSSTNNTSSLADLATNINLLSQWNNILMQHQLNKKVTPDTTTPSSSTLKQQNSIKPPKEQQSVEEYINSWLKAQEAILSHSRSNGLPPVTTTTNSTSNMQSSWFWNWYKQLSYQQSATPAVTPEKPILYQQLTKDSPDAENLSVDKSNNNNKVKSVLDNLLHINNNNVTMDKKDCLSYSEAVEHGEKFLKWLESCSNPSVTAMQIMQFRALLSNVKNSADRKNGDHLQNKTKVKRK